MVCSCDCAIRGRNVVSLHSDALAFCCSRDGGIVARVAFHNGVYHDNHVQVSCGCHAASRHRNDEWVLCDTRADGIRACECDTRASCGSPHGVVADNDRSDDDLACAPHDAEGSEEVAVVCHNHLELAMQQRLPKVIEKLSVIQIEITHYNLRSLNFI